ncbi:MAG: BatA domain-containing protein, partial [Rhodobacteraceae bacterium]|nr:BatA domain-containing protein [Paracoccaceae bacterium]
MMILGPLGFANPLLLLGLVALPVLWILLRVVPPAPIRRRFPGVALLLGLKDEDHETDRTPWWLLLLRMIAIAALILGFAGPVLNPEPREPGSGPVLILADGSWAEARDWPRRQDRIAQMLTDAARAGRPAALVSVAGGADAITFTGAGSVAETL